MNIDLRSRGRASTFRRAGWLAVATLVLSALALPGVVSAHSADVTCTNGQAAIVIYDNPTGSDTYITSGAPYPGGTLLYGPVSNGSYNVANPGTYYIFWTNWDSPGNNPKTQTVRTCPPATSTTATLTLVKNVNNEVGGDASATDWTLTATGPTTISGKTGDTAITGATVNVGAYALSEGTGPANYDASLWNCGAATVTAGSVTLAAGDNVTCTITNTYNYTPPSTTYCIDIGKVNGSEQALSGAVFTIKQDSSPVDVTGNPVTTNSDGNASLCGLSAGTYTVTETTPPSGYTGAADQSVTLPVDNATGNGSLTFVDTLIPPPPPVCTVNCNPVVLTPALTVTKFVSLSQSGPFAGHSVTTTVGTTVWYQVTMTNNGQEALSGVTFSDSLGLPTSCASVPTTLSVGASYTCTYSSPATLGTTDNTATGTSSQIGPRSDTATVLGTAAPVAPQTPTGGVAGATGRPHITPPPTSALGSVPAQPAGDTWRIALLGLAALLASLLVFSPKTSPERRRR